VLCISLRYHRQNSTAKEIEVFGDMIPCRLEIITDVSEELANRIFRVVYEVISHKSCVLTYSTVRTSNFASMERMSEQKEK
jgi:hypothetical protein